MFGENKNYHQTGNGYLQYEMTLEKVVAVAANRVLVSGDAIRLVNNAFAYCFIEARFSKTCGLNTDRIRNCGQISTIMIALTFKGGDLLSHFDRIDESEAQIENTSLKQYNNHDVAPNKGKIRGYLPLEHNLDFVKLLREKLNENDFI